MTAYHVLHDIRGRGTPYETRCGMSDITWDQVRDAIARLPCIKTTTVASCAQSAEEKHIVIRFPLSSILSCVQNCDPIKECQPLRIVFYSAVHLCPESHSCQRLSHRLSVVCSFRAGVLNKGVPGVYIYIYGALYVLWPFHPAEVWGATKVKNGLQTLCLTHKLVPAGQFPGLANRFGWLK